MVCFIGCMEVRGLDDDKQSLVEELQKSGYIQSNRVRQAFLKIPRENFIHSDEVQSTYRDTPLSIGHGQTISAPHMVAIMAEALQVEMGQRVLEVGTGFGYHAAILSHLVGSHGKIYSIERIHALAEQAKVNFNKTQITNVEVFEGDGSFGLQEYAPFDRIYLTCAAPSIPQPLLKQLNNNGILLAPVGRVFCELTRVRKTNDEMITEQLGGCAFVPLIGRYGFSNDGSLGK